MIRSGIVTWESLQQALLESIKSVPDTIVISADGSETYLFSDGGAVSEIAEREHVKSHDEAKTTGG